MLDSNNRSYPECERLRDKLNVCKEKLAVYKEMDEVNKLLTPQPGGYEKLWKTTREYVRAGAIPDELRVQIDEKKNLPTVPS